MQFWRTSTRPVCGTTKYHKRGIRSTSAPPIRMNVYGRRGGVAGVASVTSSGQRSDRDVSGASSPARGRRARRPQQPRGTVSPPSGVLRTPHSRPSDERPHRHPAPVKDGGSGSRNTRTARFWRTSKLPACAGTTRSREADQREEIRPSECLRSVWLRRRRARRRQQPRRHRLCTRGSPPHPLIPRPLGRGLSPAPSTSRSVKIYKIFFRADDFFAPIIFVPIIFT